MTVELYRYQKVGVRKIERFDGRALLADEMGLGKTVQALWWAKHYLDDDAKIVVICPASVKWNWQREGARLNIRSEVLSGMKADFLPNSKLFVINYDILAGRKKNRITWLRLLKQAKPSLVIVDECHYIKSRNAIRTKAVRAICKRAPHVVMISGTPLTNRPVELFTALNILLPREFYSFSDFAWRYCDPQPSPWGMEFKGATNLPELHQRLKETCMIRRLKADVLTDLPDKTRSVLPMELSTADMTQYRKAENEFIAWLRKLSPEAARSAEKAAYLTKIGYLKRLAGILKLKQCMEWIENFLIETDQKLIFFGVHKKFLGPIYQRFKGVSLFVDGSVTGRKRQLAFDAFTNVAHKRLLIGNIHAAGTGWNGQVASNVGFGELDWSPGVHTQAEDRCHRIGQSRGVMCHYLVSRGTIEEKLCAILQEKQGVLNSVLDGNDNLKLDILSKLDQLLLGKVK